MGRNAKHFYFSFMLIPYSILRLDLIGSFLILAVSIALVAVKDPGITASAAGLSVAYALQVMGRLQMTVSCSIETENHMVAVERLRELATMPQEQDVIKKDGENNVNHNSNDPDPSWPSRGNITLK